MPINIIFSNIAGFDGLIFLLALVNVFIFISARKSVMKLYDSTHKKIITPSLLEDAEAEYNSLSSSTVTNLVETANSGYVLYVNISSLFPLMGVLGTVISLIGMVGSSTDINDSFFAALTSTFWGLVFAIIFKSIDGFISAKLDVSEHIADLLIQDNRSCESKKEPAYSGEAQQ